ncbi:hypothetical protein CC80DRAFT_567725 [Byssothecium circinans]|uniref:Uncharacterized protein n=1 Tax=Byssothecium circinans TaxID=147558 RepID=A0A6A5TP37_9PLEO|nr:hypothetical protein CC80DRAFT_567725 [Byssothecium circinans]
MSQRMNQDMAALWPIELPYGLSHYHQHIQTLGQVDLRHGLTPSLSATPRRPRHSLATLPREPRLLPLGLELQNQRRGKRREREDIAIQVPKRPMRLGGQVVKRRTRALKPKPKAKATREPKKGRPFGEKVGLRKQQQQAIVIDDSDEEMQETNTTTNSPLAASSRSHKSNGPSDWLQDSIRSYRIITAPIPYLDIYRYTASPAPFSDPIDTLYRNQRGFTLKKDFPVPQIEPIPSEVIYEGTPPKIANYSFPQSRSATPLVFRTSYDSFAHPQEAYVTPTPTRGTTLCPFAETFTLADISDFELRKNVAQLMAVAPALPVWDLYNLLVEKKGKFDEARDRVFRRSPQGHREIFGKTHAVPKSPSPMHEASDLVMLNDGDGDEEDDVMIKLDLNDRNFLDENDIPFSPSPAPIRKSTTRRKERNQTTQNSKTKKAKALQRTKLPQSKCAPPTSNAPSTVINPTLPQHQTSFTCSKLPPSSRLRPEATTKSHTPRSPLKLPKLKRSISASGLSQSQSKPKAKSVCSTSAQTANKSKGNVYRSRARARAVAKEALPQAASRNRPGLLEKITSDTDDDWRTPQRKVTGRLSLLTHGVVFDEPECDGIYEESEAVSSTDIEETSSDDDDDDEASDVEIKEIEEELRIDMEQPFLIRPINGYR